MILPDVTELAEIVFADAVSIIDTPAPIEDRIKWVIEEYQKDLSTLGSYWDQVCNAARIAKGKYVLMLDLKHPANQSLDSDHESNGISE